jgi:hypothetical protein
VNRHQRTALRAILDAKYALVELAYRRKDLSLIEQLLAPEFHIQLTDGTRLLRDQVLAGFAVQFVTLSDVRWRRSIVDLVADGDVATATTRGVFASTSTREDGRPYHTETPLVTVDTWARRPNGWQMIRSLPSYPPGPLREALAPHYLPQW